MGVRLEDGRTRPGEDAASGERVLVSDLRRQSAAARRALRQLRDHRDLRRRLPLAALARHGRRRPRGAQPRHDPARLFGRADLPPELVLVPAWATIFTSMFMHGGFLHIGGNMLYLWIFGDNIEDSMGHVRYAVFYLLCGTAAALTQAYVDPGLRGADDRRERRDIRRARRLCPASSRRHDAGLHLPRLLLLDRARPGADRARRLVPDAAFQRRGTCGPARRASPSGRISAASSPGSR